MRDSVRLSCAAACLLSALGLRAEAGHGPQPPSDVKDVLVAGESITLSPYTTPDFENPSDPINLLFPNADPRAIRQALLKLDGVRTGFPPVPGAGCTWTDAMGYEHAAFVEPAGYVGGSRAARVRDAGRAARKPLSLPHPAVPVGPAHRGQRPLRVPGPGNGRTRGLELGPGARARHLRHGTHRPPDGGTEQRRHDPARLRQGGATARVPGAGAGRCRLPARVAGARAAGVGRRSDSDERRGARVRRVAARQARFRPAGRRPRGSSTRSSCPSPSAPRGPPTS